MSNFLAPATVTAALAIGLQQVLAADTSGLPGDVTIGRPDEIESNGAAAGVNIYLYQVTPNTAWRNADVPTRNPRGELMQRPRVALDLHYLLTFFGSEASLEDQRLMGHVVSALHDRPVLTDAMIQDARQDQAFNAFLGDSDLANEVEQVKFSPLTFNLEELSKLWSVFFQTPYHLSMAYLASVVFIERQAEPAQALPVQDRIVTAIPSVDLDIVITPDQLSDLQLWLKSDAGVTFGSEGVSLWEDQSGSENHAVQSEPAQRPAFVAHGLGTYPVLRFDGDDDRLAIQSLNYSEPLAGVTVCAVVRSASVAEQVVVSFDGARYWELALSNGVESSDDSDPVSPAEWRTTDTTDTTHELPSPHSLVNPPTDSRWHLICATFDAGATPDKRLFVDGVPVAEETAHGGNSLGGGDVTRFGFVGVGSEADDPDDPVAGTGFFAGDLAELAIYNRALTDEERDQLEHYFAGRYG